MDRRPLLVTGSHRSGTTWIGEVLALTPAFEYIFEPFNPDMQPSWLRHPVTQPYLYITSATEEQFSDIASSIQRAMDFRFPLAAAFKSRKFVRAPRFALTNTFHGWRARQRHARPLLKDPLALLSAPWIADTFEAQILVTVRHPGAFAVSLMDKGWEFDFSSFVKQEDLITGPYSASAKEITAAARRPPPILDQAALLWRCLYGFVADNLERRKDTVIVRHEEVMKDPLQAFGRLFSALGVEQPEALPRALNGHAKRSRLTVASDTDRWKARLTENEKARMRQVLGPMDGWLYGETSWRPESRTTIT